MKNKALLVGINKYPNPSNELRGCVNDINDMIRFISDTNDVYKKEHILTLTDKYATKKAIVANLNWLIEDAQAGDQLLFHYSGHGAQANTMNKKEEVDGKDEIICPYDFDWTTETTLRDKEFAEIFKKIPKGVHFVWISDSCHAEDLSREVIDSNQRTHSSYRIFTGEQKPILVPSKWSFFSKEPVFKGALLSACESHQLSADAYIDNRFNGAFTHYLLKNLRKSGNEKTMQELIHNVHSDLLMNGYDQRPQFEGPLSNSKFFL